MKATLISVAVAAAVALAGCNQQQIPTGTSTSTQLVNIYANEDLSGAPISEPVNQLVVNASGGIVCYATDRSHQDPNQYYVNCDAAIAAGANIAPAN